MRAHTATTGMLSKNTADQLFQDFRSRLASDEPEKAFAWIAQALLGLPPAQRAANASLIAYTGRLEAIAWLEGNVASPVTDAWGVAAALLGTPWPRIQSWLMAAGARRLMALDALLAYRSPAPNMSPLHQIVAPVLPEAPTLGELETRLARVLVEAPTPRIEGSVASIRAHAAQIVSIRSRNVAVVDLPRLFLDPQGFQGATPILQRHAEISAGIRESVEQVIRDHESRTRH